MDDGQQLALVLFDNLAPQGLTVEKAPAALGFHRSNAFVQIVDLSLAGRRLLDVMYFFVSAAPEIQKIYTVDYGLFKWLLGTTSANRAHLKRLVREAQMAAIELNGSNVQSDNNLPWGSVPLMSSAFIANGQFIFELPERLQVAIRNPQATHFLSLRYVFKSLYSKILYDRLQPFMKDGATPWLDLESLRVWLECEKKTYSIFKHFRAKVLDVAVAEICEVTGLKVAMVTLNVPGSKKIGQVRFQWDANQKTDEQKTAFVVLRDTYETLRNEFGLNQVEFDEIVKNRMTFTDERIQRAIEYTRHAANAGKINKRAGGYFMKALREEYVIGTIDQQIHERKAATAQLGAVAEGARSKRETAADKDFTARQKREAAAGWEAYESMPEEEQLGLVREFTNLPTSAMIAKRLDILLTEISQHLSNPAVHTAFGAFVSLRLQQASKTDKGDNTANLFGTQVR